MAPNTINAQATPSVTLAVAGAVVVDLGVSKLRLLTNNPAKYGGLEGYNLQIVERVPLLGETTEENLRYLETKKNRMGHLIDVSAPDASGQTDEAAPESDVS